jgi:hypothetical protein
MAILQDALNVLGPHSYKATSYAELEIVLNDIRKYTESVNNRYVSITSITPIIIEQNGSITGSIGISTIDTTKSTGMETTGTYTIKTPNSIKLTSTVEYLLIYDVSAKED